MPEKERWTKKRALAKEPPWSQYQQDIFSWVEHGQGNLLINAIAGSGKTKTLEGIVTRIHNKDTKIVMLAFNTHIRDELASRVPSGVTVATAHGYGNGLLKRYFSGAQLNLTASKYRKIATGLIADLEIDPEEFSSAYDTLVKAQAERIKKNPRSRRFDEAHLQRQAERIVKSEKRNGLVKLIDMARLTLTATDQQSLKLMVERLNLKLKGNLDDVFPLVDTAIAVGIDQARKTQVIDFTDMIFLPHALNIQPTHKDFLLVDECLPGGTPILLADGTSRTIQEIVDNKLDVEVLAYDTTTGRQRPCRITKWSRTPNQKPLVKITVWRRERVGNNTQRVQNFVVCTTDHKIWADGQWIEAGDLTPGMIAQVETSATKSAKYKITQKGKDRLSLEMTGKNSNGLCGANRGKGRIPRRGGNGKGLTEPQLLLMDNLKGDWATEFVIKTQKKPGDGYPYHYKIDIANPSRMIAVEIDGASHNTHARKTQDQKKQRLLESLGWTVIRFKNLEVMQNCPNISTELNSLVCEGGQDCPVDAEIVSIEPTTIPEYWVYDLTVEDCHNFYANGILVHNCQDANEAQLSMYKRFASSARIINVGDPFQAIQGFAGSTPDMWDRIRETFSPIELPLSVCYRCPRSHLDLARYFVPTVQARPDAPEGTIEVIAEKVIADCLQPGDLVLSRTIAPLIDLVFDLQTKGVNAKIRGEDSGSEITGFIQTNLRDYEWESFAEMSHAWVIGEIQNLADQDEDDKADDLRDLWGSVEKFHKHFASDCSSVGDLVAMIETVFTSANEPIILSTIHRSKGDEADRVFLLGCDQLLKPSRMEYLLPWEQQQEKNLVYVALTRAKQALFLVPSDENLSAPLGGLPVEPIESTHAPSADDRPVDFSVTVDEKTGQVIAPRPLIDLSDYEPEVLVGSHADNAEPEKKGKQKTAKGRKYDNTWDIEDYGEYCTAMRSQQPDLQEWVRTRPPAAS